MTRRLFVAAWLPGGASLEAAGIRERLRDTGADVKWVPPENLHVTLRFLGDVGDERIPSLAGTLASALGSFAPFDLQLAGLGAFPPRGAPRVVWVGIEAGGRELAALASAAERALIGSGHLRSAEERPFRAHVTLGRPRSSRGIGRLMDLLEETSFAGRAHLLEEVRLVESRLSPRGAEYTAVARVPLAGERPRRFDIP